MWADDLCPPPPAGLSTHTVAGSGFADYPTSPDFLFFPGCRARIRQIPRTFAGGPSRPRDAKQARPWTFRNDFSPRPGDFSADRNSYPPGYRRRSPHFGNCDSNGSPLRHCVRGRISPSGTDKLYGHVYQRRFSFNPSELNITPRRVAASGQSRRNREVRRKDLNGTKWRDNSRDRNLVAREGENYLGVEWSVGPPDGRTIATFGKTFYDALLGHTGTASHRRGPFFPARDYPRRNTRRGGRPPRYPRISSAGPSYSRRAAEFHRGAPPRRAFAGI